MKGVVEIDEMAEKGRDINGFFRPSKNGFLGEGFIGFTYNECSGIFFLF